MGLSAVPELGASGAPAPAPLELSAFGLVRQGQERSGMVRGGQDSVSALGRPKVTPSLTGAEAASRS